jgi:hypothetical protein
MFMCMEFPPLNMVCSLHGTMSLCSSHKRVLALSRDRGSIQAIVSVAAMLQANSVYVSLFSPPDCHPLVRHHGLMPSILDMQEFSVSPNEYISTLFQDSNPDLLLMGSSPAAGERPGTPEQFAINEARKLGIPSITVLDSWGMYEERFCGKDNVIADAMLPDKICALDIRCRDDLIRLGVPESRIAITHNPWLDKVAAEGETPFVKKSTGNLRALFVSQPLNKLVKADNHSLHYQLLSTLVGAMPPEGRHEVLIWRHPAESAERWRNSEQLGSSKVEVRVIEERSNILANLDFMATVNSTTAYEALHLGTPCFSFKFWSSLPTSYIEELGLSISITNQDELRFILDSFDSNDIRSRLAANKVCLREKGIFFSDGQATERVLAEVMRLIR